MKRTSRRRKHSPNPRKYLDPKPVIHAHVCACGDHFDCGCDEPDEYQNCPTCEDWALLEIEEAEKRKIRYQTTTEDLKDPDFEAEQDRLRHSREFQR